MQSFQIKEYRAREIGKKELKQDRAELDQAKLKLGLDFNLSSRLNLH